MIGRMKVWQVKLFVPGLAALVLAGCGDAPKPESSTSGLGGGSVTKNTLAKAIEDHVAKAGTTFSFSDPATKKQLSLTLLRVHKDRLSRIGADLYFACSDFKEAGGKVYDLDFWVKTSGDKLSVTKTMLHKEDGKARYTWHEHDGVWKQEFTAKTGAEHPKGEHHGKEHHKKSDGSGSAEHPSSEHPK